MTSTKQRYRREIEEAIAKAKAWREVVTVTADVALGRFDNAQVLPHRENSMSFSAHPLPRSTLKAESRPFACGATRLFFEGKREYSLAVRTGEPYMNTRRSRSCALPGP